MFTPVIWVALMVTIAVLVIVNRQKLLDWVMTLRATESGRESNPDSKEEETGQEEYKSVKVLKTRSNTWIIGVLILQALIVLLICLNWGEPIDGWQDIVRRLVIWLLIEAFVAMFVTWEVVPANTARGIEAFGLRIGIAREGLLIRFRWEHLSTKLDENGNVLPRLVTPEEHTFKLELDEVVQDKNTVTFSIQVTVKYEAVWTDRGISAALYGYAGDIKTHIEESVRSAIADFAGKKTLREVPQCQVELQDYVRWYFLTTGLPAREFLALIKEWRELGKEKQKEYRPNDCMADAGACKTEVNHEERSPLVETVPPLNWLIENGHNGFAYRFGYVVSRIEYKGIGGENVKAFEAEKVEEAKAKGVVKESEGQATSIRNTGEAEAEVEAMKIKKAGEARAEAEALVIKKTGEAEKERRELLASADAERVWQTMIKMAGGEDKLVAMNSEQISEVATKAARHIGVLDYNHAITISSEKEGIVIFGSSEVTGDALSEASVRSMMYKILGERLSTGKTDESDHGPAAAAGAAAGQ